MRLFLAVVPDAGVLDALGRLTSRLRPLLDTDGSLRWVAATHQHLTLHFLGDVPTADVDPLVAALDAGPLSTPAIAATLDGLGTFPPAGPPRALWIGLGRGAVAIAGLHAELAGCLAAAGQLFAVRGFTPHLTLARVGRGARAKGLRHRLAATPAPAVIPWTIDRVVLIESDLSGSRPVYTEKWGVRLGEA